MLKERACRIIKGQRAEGYVDVAVMALSMALVLALAGCFKEENGACW